jgi:hypothetical protein
MAEFISPAKTLIGDEAVVDLPFRRGQELAAAGKVNAARCYRLGGSAPHIGQG